MTRRFLARWWEVLPEGSPGPPDWACAIVSQTCLEGTKICKPAFFGGMVVDVNVMSSPTVSSSHQCPYHCFYLTTSSLDYLHINIVMSYLTVKCPIGRAVSDNAMLEAIDHRVLLISKMMHRGSHAVLLTAIHCYRVNLPFPPIKDARGATNFIRHCFNPYPRRHPNGHWLTVEVPQIVMTTSHNLWPEAADITSFTGYARHNTLQSNQYATNLQNHVEMNVWICIKLTITTFCQSCGYTASKKSPFVIDLFNAIMDPDHVCSVIAVNSILLLMVLLQVDLQSRNDFIQYHHGYLTDHDIDHIVEEGSGLTITEQSSKLVLYFVHILKYQNAFEDVKEVRPRLFYPVPVHGIKRYHMDVDNEIIYYLLKDIGVWIPRHSQVDGKNINAPILPAMDYMSLTLTTTFQSSSLRVQTRGRNSTTAMAF